MTLPIADRLNIKGAALYRCEICGAEPEASRLAVYAAAAHVNHPRVRGYAPAFPVNVTVACQECSLLAGGVPV